MNKEDKASLVKKLQDFTGLPFLPMEMKGELCAGLTADRDELEIIQIRMGQSTEHISLSSLKKIYESHQVKDSINNLSVTYIPLSKVSDDIVQLENKLRDRDYYFDLRYKKNYQICEVSLEEIKKFRIGFISQVSSSEMAAKLDTNFYKDLVVTFSKVFIACEQLKLIDFTSVNNRKRSDRLLNDLLVEVEEFFKFIPINDLSKSNIGYFSFCLFDFLKAYGETAERWSVNFEIDTRLWSSPIYLNLLLQSLNNCIVYRGLEFDINYIEKILLYGSQALESKDINPLYQPLLRRSLNAMALLTYVKSQNFQTALSFYDILISKYEAASHKDKLLELLPITKNVDSILILFKACLSSKIVEKTNLIERISNLQICLRSATNVVRTVFSSKLKVQEKICFSENQSAIQEFIQSLETIRKEASVNSKNSKKKNKKKQAQKNKLLTVLPEKKPETLKPKEDKTDIFQAPEPSEFKDNKLNQVSALIPPPTQLPRTIRISLAEIDKSKQLKKNKYLKTRKTKVERVEDKSAEPVYYPLTNRFMPSNKKIQAMITKELIEKLPLSLLNAAILVLRGGLIGVKKNEVNPLTETDRQRFKLPQAVTHGMTLTGKFGTYHLFAQWSKEKEDSLEFKSSDYTMG